MHRFAGVFVLLLSFCLPCRAETFADMWNGSGLAEHCFYLAGWLDGTRGICGSRTDDLCGLVKGNFDLQSMERIVSIVYELPLYWEVPYTAVFGLSLRYLEGKIGTEDFARRLNAAAEGRESSRREACQKGTQAFRVCAEAQVSGPRGWQQRHRRTEYRQPGETSEGSRKSLIRVYREQGNAGFCAVTGAPACPRCSTRVHGQEKPV